MNCGYIKHLARQLAKEPQPWFYPTSFSVMTSQTQLHPRGSLINRYFELRVMRSFSLCLLFRVLEFIWEVWIEANQTPETGLLVLPALLISIFWDHFGPVRGCITSRAPLEHVWNVLFTASTEHFFESLWTLHGWFLHLSNKELYHNYIHS